MLKFLWRASGFGIVSKSEKAVSGSALFVFLECQRRCLWQSHDAAPLPLGECFQEILRERPSRDISAQMVLHAAGPLIELWYMLAVSKCEKTVYILPLLFLATLIAGGFAVSQSEKAVPLHVGECVHGALHGTSSWFAFAWRYCLHFWIYRQRVATATSVLPLGPVPSPGATCNNQALLWPGLLVEKYQQVVGVRVASGARKVAGACCPWTAS